jgi:hypothetical protein
MDNLCIVSTSPACHARAKEIAELLGLSASDLNDNPEFAHLDYQLLVAENGLSIRKKGSLTRDPWRTGGCTVVVETRR